MTGAAAVGQRDALDMDLAQYRRHRRAHIHAQRDRLYYLPGDKQPVAHNRHKRCDQGDVDSLAEFRKAHPQDVGRLTVKRAVRLYTPNRAKAPAVGGEVWSIGGVRLVVGWRHGWRNCLEWNRRLFGRGMYANMALVAFLGMLVTGRACCKETILGVRFLGIGRAEGCL